MKWTISLILWLLTASPALGQSAAISYQGHLTEAGRPANGPYDMQFKLFNSAAAGAPLRNTITIPSVPTTEGVFTVTLDFDEAVFDGSPRFLEISVKPGGTAIPYTTLVPRQQVASVPYAVHSLSASQLNGVPSSSFLQANADGNVGIGTSSPATGVRLEVIGPTRVTAGGSGGYLQIGTPNGETGLGTRGTNRFDLRFNGHTLTLAAGPDVGPTPPQFGITMNTNGNVGIGMPSPLPASQWKLEVDGATRLTTSQGAVQFNTPNGEMGMSYQSFLSGRADLRFDGFTLKLVAGLPGGPPSAANGIAITTEGDVGIGTTRPAAKLQVETSEAKPAVYGNATGAGTGVYGRSATGPAVHAEGNATQAQDKGGFVKAMAYIDPFLPADQYVVRCYNSHPPQNAPATTTRPCGIVAKRPDQPGHYTIDFGFNVEGRFISLTARETGSLFGNVLSVSGNSVEVRFTEIDSGDSRVTDTRFYIMVY